MIGILTFHWADDYGAMLQTYALKSCLNRLSKETVNVIPYEPIKFVGNNWMFPVIGVEADERIRYVFSCYIFKRNRNYWRKLLRRRQSMRAFRHQYLTKGPVIRNVDRLSLERYSCVFVGSDQVWNPALTVGLDAAYIGNVKEKGNCRLIAYGASFGSDSLPPKYHAAFEKALNHNFSAVSVREKSAVPFIKDIFNGYVTDVLDPTLLLEQEEWKKMAKLSKQKNYILFLYTEYNEEMLKYLRNISVEFKRKVLQLNVPWPGEETDWTELTIEGGPSEYIGFFQNADYVVTNSFHGMIFSIFMEKQFLVFSHKSRNARLKNFMEKAGLDSRLIEIGRIPAKEEILQDIDWKHVRKLIEKEREASIEFIKKNIC